MNNLILGRLIYIYLYTKQIIINLKVLNIPISINNFSFFLNFLNILLCLGKEMKINTFIASLKNQNFIRDEKSYENIGGNRFILAPSTYYQIHAISIANVV